MRQNAMIPRSGLAFAELLIKHGILQHHAVDDPEGYDEYDMMDRCYEAHAEMTSSENAIAQATPTPTNRIK